MNSLEDRQEWSYVDRSGQQRGPISWEAIRRLYRQKALTLDSLAMHAERTDGAWRPLREMNYATRPPTLVGRRAKDTPQVLSVVNRVDNRWPGGRRRVARFFSRAAYMLGIFAGLAGFFAPTAAYGPEGLLVGFLSGPLAALPWFLTTSLLTIVCDLHHMVATMETLQQESRDNDMLP